MLQKYKELHKILVHERQQYLDRMAGRTVEYKAGLHTSKGGDDADHANSGTQEDLTAHLNNREAFYLKKVDEAIARMNEGTFGICEDCDEEIDARRLKARPTATLCIECKESREHEEKNSQEI